MDEQLIELVREHEELYNFADKRYSDNQHKNKLWREIGEQLKKNSDYCKKRWESLRSQFRKICRFRKTKTGQAAKNAKKWKYEEELSFLLSYMKDKDRLTSVEGEDLSSDESQIAEEDHAAGTDNIADDSIASQETTPRLNLPQKRKFAKATEKKKSTSVAETAGSTLMKYLIEQKTVEESQPKKDALDHFFDGVKATVKEFSPQDRHIAKTKIFNIISEIEAKYINFEDNPQASQQLHTLLPAQGRPYDYQYIANISSGPSSYSAVPSGPSSNYSAASVASNSNQSSCASYLESYTAAHDEYYNNNN